MKGPPLTLPQHTTLDTALAAAAAGNAGLTFVDRDESETTLRWREVRARAERFAGGLAAAGIAPGDRVALVLPTAPSFVVAFFGAILARAVPVPLYPPVRLGRLAEYHAATASMATAAGARMIVTDARIGRLLGQVAAQAAPPLGCRDVADLDAGKAIALAAAPDDLALVQFSSGTTRSPRPVALTHGALTAQCAALLPLLRGSDPAAQLGVSWLPLYHDMGLIGALLGAVTYPGSLVLIPPELFLARPALWLRAIARHRATISPAPPFAFALCARRVGDADLAGCDLASWRLAICGAEPVAPAVLERFSRRFAPFGFDARAIAPAYGLAEAALAVTCTPPGEGPTDAGVDARALATAGEVHPGSHRVASVGVPMPGVEIALRNEDGTATAGGRVGRIWVRGPTLMRGYLGQKQETAVVLADGWLDTGDLGFVANERLHVTGRAKDVLIVRGANHRPQEFEDCLDGLPGVRPGRVVATSHLPADADGEVLVMLVECTVPPVGQDADRLAATIRQAVRERTGVQPHAVELLAPGSLPRTSSGKLRRAEARRRYLSGDLTPPGRVDAVTVTGAVVKSAWAYARARWRR